MKKIILMALVSLTLTACDKHEKPKNPPVSEQDSDNTGKNVRDRNSTAITPLDQSENEADRTITQRIRQAIMADGSLSTNAKNIKIVTINGVVTLRGPVANTQEREAIARKISNVQGIAKVDNQLEITQKSY